MRTVYGYEYANYDSSDCNFTSNKMYATKTQNKDAMWKVASELVRDINAGETDEHEHYEAVGCKNEDGKFHISIVNSHGDPLEGITEVIYTIME